MKQNGITLNLKGINGYTAEEIGEAHLFTTPQTPMRPDAFDLSDEEKMHIIAGHFRQIMETLGLDLTDDSLQGTPQRVAKMYVKEIFSGLNPANEPPVKMFDNSFRYNEMLIEKGIPFTSTCEHHFVPITGVAHCAYISNGKVVGLSKINRMVHYYARRPQVQERMTVQIASALSKALGTPDVAVVLEAEHMCISTRGIQDKGSATVTAEYMGRFREESVRNEFLSLLKGAS